MKIVGFFKAIYQDNAARKRRRRVVWKDVLLYLLNRALYPVERFIAQRHYQERLPLVFIVGVPRSGTTLLFQLMASYLGVAYPSNVVARFWGVPVIGAIAQALLTKLRSPSIALQADHGKTSGYASPHEFAWFWQFRSEWPRVDDLDEPLLRQVDIASIRRDLRCLAGWFGKPLVLKSLNYCDYQIAWLARQLPEARFIWIRREPIYVVQSVLESRMRFYGTEQLWWSIRPRDVDNWREADPIDQVVHQMADISQAIQRDLALLSADRFRVLDYERLVENPQATLQDLSVFLNTELVDRRQLEQLTLRSGNIQRFDAERLAKVQQVLRNQGA